MGSSAGWVRGSSVGRRSGSKMTGTGQFFVELSGELVLNELGPGDQILVYHPPNDYLGRLSSTNTTKSPRTTSLIP